MVMVMPSFTYSKNSSPKESTTGISMPSSHTLHGAGTVEHQSAGGGADGLGQAQRLAHHLLAKEIGIVLIAAGGHLITELQRLLEGCQGIQTPVAHQCGGGDGSGSDHTALEFLHITCPPW